MEIGKELRKSAITSMSIHTIRLASESDDEVCAKDLEPPCAPFGAATLFI